MVIDGDTLAIQGQRIRLYGIDAPESRQTCQDENGDQYRCGESATLALSEKIGHGTIACDYKDVDRYRRIVGVCWTGDEDLNGWLVSEGWAVAYTRYSARYLLAEGKARLAGRGLWAGSFVEPEKWRREKRQ
jgi:endonuclease YncB( thermonuclease family)